MLQMFLKVRYIFIFFSNQGIGLIKRIKRNEILILNKEYFLSYDSKINWSNKIQILNKEISFLKRLINKTNSKINKIKKNFYLISDDILSNEINQDFIAIKSKNNIKPEIKIIPDSEDNNGEKDENIQINESYDNQFYFDINMDNNTNRYLEENKAMKFENFDRMNITKQTSISLDKKNNDNPIELFLISNKSSQYEISNINSLNVNLNFEDYQ